jgi:hypothetical protein
MNIEDMDIIKQIKGTKPITTTGSIDAPFIQTFIQDNGAKYPFIDNTIKLEVLNSKAKTSGSYNNIIFFNADFGEETNKRFAMRIAKNKSEVFEAIVERRGVTGTFFESAKDWKIRNMAKKNAIINDYTGTAEIRRKGIREMLKRWVTYDYNKKINIITELINTGMSSLNSTNNGDKLKMGQFLKDIAFGTKSYENWIDMSDKGIGLKVYAYAYFLLGKEYKLGTIMDAGNFDLKTCIENLRKPKRHDGYGMKFVPNNDATQHLNNVFSGMNKIPNDEKVWKGEYSCNLFNIQKDAPLTSFEVLVAEKTMMRIKEQVEENILCTDLKSQNCAGILKFDDYGNVIDIDIYIIDIDSDFCDSINVGNKDVIKNNVLISNLFMSNQFYYQLSRNIFCQHFINKSHTQKIDNIPTSAALTLLCDPVLGNDWRKMVKHYQKRAVREACNIVDAQTCKNAKKDICEKLFGVLMLNSYFLNTDDQLAAQAINDEAAKICANNSPIPDIHLDDINRSSPSPKGLVGIVAKGFQNLLNNIFFMGGRRKKTKKRRKPTKKRTRKKKKRTRRKKKKKRTHGKRTFRKPTF